MTHRANTCFNCGAGCTVDQFCEECLSYVCDECSVNKCPKFLHDPEEHLVDQEACRTKDYEDWDQQANAELDKMARGEGGD